MTLRLEDLLFDDDLVDVELGPVAGEEVADLIQQREGLLVFPRFLAEFG